MVQFFSNLHNQRKNVNLWLKIVIFFLLLIKAMVSIFIPKKFYPLSSFTLGAAHVMSFILILQYGFAGSVTVNQTIVVNFFSMAVLFEAETVIVMSRSFFQGGLCFTAALLMVLDIVFRTYKEGKRMYSEFASVRPSRSSH